MTLETPISEITRILPAQAKALARLKITTARDLLYHFPARYGDTASVKHVNAVSDGETVTLFGKVSNLKSRKSFRTKVPMAEGTFTDDTGTIRVVWFSQPYIAKMISDEMLVRLDGKITERKGSLFMNNPKIEKVIKIPTGVGDSLFEKKGSGRGDTPGSEFHLYPVYPETRGLTSNWMYHVLQKIFSSGILDELEDPIPADILKRYNLPTLSTALVWIHGPKNEKDAMSARKRFSFEEILLLQLSKFKAKKAQQQLPSFTIKKSTKDLAPFISKFPFTPTNAQKKAIGDILSDFKKGYGMSRLLEGDVGSGKTAVAASTIYAVATTHPEGKDFGYLQTAYMVPTEVLAKQHFESFIEYFRDFPIPIALITGSECRKFPSKVDPNGWTKISKAQLKKWVANGEIPVVIGTHALIQKTVEFKHLAYVIIDEQHRFGTLQRQKLLQKNETAPHLLSMTATPIPRTLALTIYGDLDLTILDQMPSGRKPIITEIITPNDRDGVYEKIKKELAKGRQAYVICPRIDEPDPDKAMTLNVKSVTEEAKRLKRTIFQDQNIDILHSKMTPADKEDTMNRFKAHEIDILCATSVVEVGVNVPNATVIILEGAQRFGLAQLHQLRGRVIRSNHQAYCFVFADSKTKTTVGRLKALKTAKNGFELSEFDLKFRGPGELVGRKQAGITDIGMDALTNLKLVEAAQKEAEALLENDPELKKHSVLSARLRACAEHEIHLE
ncbi:ATP-dependent DNA helicase RecG [Candidatus Wolfebacteria bacterium]|nr:MAG: ATP-dependent DNA helicase RecG [Candidatus Wolfebacteria bacterium]